MIRLKKIGAITPQSSKDVTKSRFGIGFEKLDRAVFEPSKAYDSVAGTGVKYVRIQSGWMRTEKEKGTYDFSWLDGIVENLTLRGLRVWMCLCYGNPLYDELSKETFGAVGCPPIHSAEALDAWCAYCDAVAKRYSGRVFAYEIWNEPDGIHCWKHGVSATEYGSFAVATAKAVRKADPEAEIYAGGLCRPDLPYTSQMLSTEDLYRYIDGVTFHAYTADDFSLYGREKAFIACVKSFDSGLKVIQGESGTQSRYGGSGALKKGKWDERKQAKLLLRHLVTDLDAGVEFTSYFTTVDMIEALHGKVDDKASYLDYGYFGVLAAQFDENGFSIGDYAKKPSYYALQTLTSALSGEWEIRDLPVSMNPEWSYPVFGPDCKDATKRAVGFVRPSGASAFVFWNACDLMTCDYEGTITLTVCANGKELRLLDMYDGAVYSIPGDMCQEVAPGVVKLTNFPIKDYPMMLLIGDFEKEN